MPWHDKHTGNGGGGSGSNVAYTGTLGYGTRRLATVAAGMLTALNGDQAVYDLRDSGIDWTGPAFNAADIGPALQAAFDAIAAATGRGTIVIPNGQNVLVTPVSKNLGTGQRIMIVGESQDAAIVFNCGDTNDGITVGHAVGATGLLFGMRDLVFRGFIDATYSMKHAVKVDMDARGTQLFVNITCFGCYARQAIIRCEDGTALCWNITYFGCAADQLSVPNGGSLLRLFETYRGEVQHIYQYNIGDYNGTTWNGGGSTAMLDWYAPQLNFGGASSFFPRGDLYIDDWHCESQPTYGFLINNLATHQGGKVTIKHGTGSIQLGASSGIAMIFARAVDLLEVDTMYCNTATAGSGWMVLCYAVTRTILRALHGETAADGGPALNGNLVGFLNTLGNNESVDLEECVLGATSGAGGFNNNGTVRCGVDADPAITRVRFLDKGRVHVLKKASAAIPVNAIVEYDPAAAVVEGIIVAPIGAGSSDPIGVAFDAATALNDLIRVTEHDGEEVLMVSDGAGVLAPGDALQTSGVTAGDVAKNAVATTPAVGTVLTAAVAVPGTVFKARWGKFSK